MLLDIADLDRQGRETAMGLVRTYLKRTTVAPPAQTSLVATAIQVLAGSEGGLPTQTGIDVVKKALKERTWGFRITRQSTRIRTALIFVPFGSDLPMKNVGVPRTPARCPATRSC